MEVRDCLRAELHRVTAIVSAVAPEMAAYRSWVRRFVAFLAHVVI